MIIIAGLLVLLADFSVCLRIPFEVESEALSKRQTSNHSTTQIGEWLNPYFCQPTPVAVEVPPPAVFPRHVKLWRCMGSVYNPDIWECGVENEAPFHLRVVVKYGVPLTMGTVPMTNHTVCGYECILKEKNCNNATHILEPHSCQCYCRNNIQCGPGKVWDTNGCKCECKNIARTCVGHEDTKIWSDNTCKCECQEKIVKKCQTAGHGKTLKPDTCACVCPQRVCPKGYVIDQTDCKCARSV